MNVEKEIENIKKQLSVLIKNYAKDKRYINYDIEAGRVNTSKAQRSAEEANELGINNANTIESTEQLITDIDITQIELEERITELEAK